MSLFAATGNMILNYSFLGLGAALAITAVILGIARATGRDTKQWSMLFSTLTILASLIIPQGLTAGILFATGIATLTWALIPLMNQNNATNIYGMAIMVIIMDVIMLISAGVYQSNALELSRTQTYTETQISSYADNLKTLVTGTDYTAKGLCNPLQDVNCKPNYSNGQFNPNNFDILSSIINIGGFVAQFLTTAGLLLIAPFAISLQLTKTLGGSSVLIMILGFYLTMWNLIVLKPIAVFIFGKLKV